MRKVNCELLAPAGSFEALEAALHFGADAVYIGGPFMQMRSESVGFGMKDVERAVNAVHEKNKKIYVTVNCFAFGEELGKIADYASELHGIGADALIVSDLGAASVIKNKCPDAAIHVSTQANVTNSETAKVWYNLGASRVVPARELSLEQIAAMRREIPADMEIECFVHGAMCMSYSGRCLISSFLNGRSGNRGECSQPCRWRYKLVEEKRPGQYFDVIEEGGASAILSSHDMRCIDFLPELEKAGVCSFKIEGRMKTAYYVATVVNAYRRAMDGFGDMNTLIHELDCASHRPFSTGFYFGQLKKDHFNSGEYSSKARFAAVVLEKQGENRYLLEMRNRFKTGDELQILSPNSIGEKIVVADMQNEEDEPIDDAYIPQMKVSVTSNVPLSPGDFLRIES